MKGKNKYCNRSRISEKKFREIVKLFSMDLTAVQIVNLTGLNRNTVNRYLHLFRDRIVELCELDSPFSGEIEVDESYFGARRVKGKRGRGAYGKTIVFGLLKREGKVYTEIVPNCQKTTLQAIIRGHVEAESVIYSDGWRGYNGLVDIGYDKHFRVYHGENEFVRGNSHINGIESFWSYAKMRLHKFCKFHSHVSTRFTLMFPPVSQTCFHSFHFYVSIFWRFCEMILEKWLANASRLNLIFSFHHIRWSGYGETQHVKNQRGVSTHIRIQTICETDRQSDEHQSYRYQSVPKAV